MDHPRWTVWLPATFGVIVLSFVAATLLNGWQMRAIDRTASDIADNAAPSIEHLAAARAEVRNLQLILLDELAGGATGFDEDRVEASQRVLDGAINEYLVLTPFDKERDLWRDVLGAKNRLDESVTRIEDDVRRGRADDAMQLTYTDVASAAAALSDAITRLIELNAARAHDLALEIQSLRARGTRAALALDVACSLIALVGAILLRQVIRAHAELTEAHRRLQEERATELEQFAGRVAHDILSPLNTVMLGLDLVDRAPPEQRATVIERSRSAIDRVKRLVTALLSFARAGAKPEPGAVASVRETLADLATELEPAAADAHVELVVEPVDANVACHEGVLTSLVSNLARNAMKYIGEGPLRRVAIRAVDRGAAVRVEVEDTGPGLPIDVEDHVFEPYTRGRNSKQPGIGLGLATVKRLAESHGGSVGVRSQPGRGCVFWFELPAA